MQWSALISGACGLGGSGFAVIILDAEDEDDFFSSNEPLIELYGICLMVGVRQPLPSATPPHWETSSMAIGAIPGSTRRRIACRLPNRIQLVFGLAAVFYSTIGMGWQKMHKRVEAWKQKKIHINNKHTLRIFI
jgi:hypothetical protein